MEVKKELWGKSACGKEIYLYTLTNSKGAYVQLGSVGAAIVSVVVPDKDGNLADVSLGYADPVSYFGDGPFMGKTPGRYANRISNGSFEIGGNKYEITKNEKVITCLHGGGEMSHALWDAKVISENSVLLTICIVPLASYTICPWSLSNFMVTLL